MTFNRIAALQCTTLFGGLTAEVLADIAQRAAELHLQKSEMLFLAGEPARGLFVVVSGKIRAFQQNEDGREQVMYPDTAGSVLGDVPVFDDDPIRSQQLRRQKRAYSLLKRATFVNCAQSIHPWHSQHSGCWRVRSGSMQRS